MPTAVCDGIPTRYEVLGDGPPLLLFSPGGFNATVENWSSFGIYARLNLLEHLRERFTCIAFDKRESGRSGGRLERIGWSDYAAQGLGLLDELGIECAHVMGGCIGCSIAATMAVLRPERVSSLVLYSPAGGPRYRLMQRSRFAEHAAFASEHGLGEVVALARGGEKTFAQDPRVGPWVSVIRADPAFADDYVRREVEEYVALLTAWGDALFDRDTVPGPEPEQLLTLELPALVVPGNDPSHARSASHYLHECLPRSELWDVLPEEQTEETAPTRILEFLGSVQSSDSPRSSAAI
jgi:pimeloyl-ACP methyl ester carboxylesterase